MLHNYKAMDMINFAVASSAIKHTIHGDANITDDVSTIRNLMNMSYSIFLSAGVGRGRKGAWGVPWAGQSEARKKRAGPGPAGARRRGGRLCCC